MTEITYYCCKNKDYYAKVKKLVLVLATSLLLTEVSIENTL